MGPCSTPVLGAHKETGKVAGKVEPISPRMEASLREPKLDFSIGWTRRGVLFWEDDRSHDTMVTFLRDPDLLPKATMALTKLKLTLAFDSQLYKGLSISTICVHV